MRIKKDDTVIVIAGKDKGHVGKVLRVMPSENRVVVEGANIQTKHQKQTQKEPAQIKHVEGPIDASNVMLYDKSSKTAVKTRYEIRDGRKVRVDKKTGSVID